MREEDEDLSRAGISTRGMNRKKLDEFANEDLDMTQVPQVSILDTDGKNMKLDQDTDEDQEERNELDAPEEGKETRALSEDSQEARVNALLE